MSDDPEVTPEQEARLRRLLGEARHGEPVPGDVAARLDRVLEQLAGEEADPHAGRPPIDLAARRRGRATRLLVAAAAVVVLGVGVGQLVDTSGGDSATSAESADTATDAGADTAAGPDDAGGAAADSAPSSQEALPEALQAQPEAGATSSDDSSSELAVPLGAPSPPVRLTEAGFAAQAERFSTRRGTESSERAVVPGEALSRAEGFVCETADWGPGRLVPALYDGVPAVLAYREVAGATQTVDLLRCGTGELLRSIVLPVPDPE